VNYCYVLLSEHDGRFYIGSTGDLRVRFKQHNAGAVRSTSYRRPLVLAYYEACLSIDDARRRERYLKSGCGGRYLKQRLATWLCEIDSDKLERH
jgi:putative endonuclease